MMQITLKQVLSLCALIASMALASVVTASEAASISPNQYLGSVLILGDWGGGGSKNQRLVAQRMAEFASKPGVKVLHVVSSGDNFYPDGIASLEDPQWRLGWKDIYQSHPAMKQVPWFITLGNHDFHRNPWPMLQMAGHDPLWVMSEDGSTPKNTYWNRVVSVGGVRFNFVHLNTNAFIGRLERVGSSANLFGLPRTPFGKLAPIPSALDRLQSHASTTSGDDSPSCASSYASSTPTSSVVGQASGASTPYAGTPYAGTPMERSRAFSFADIDLSEENEDRDAAYGDGPAADERLAARLAALTIEEANGLKEAYEQEQERLPSFPRAASAAPALNARKLAKSDRFLLHPEKFGAFTFDEYGQLAFVKKQLTNADEADWTILVGHHPLVGGKRKEDPRRPEHANFGYLAQMVAEYKPDFYIAGHVHKMHYLRDQGVNHLVIGSGCETEDEADLQSDPDQHLYNELGFGFMHLYRNQVIYGFVNAHGKVIFHGREKKSSAPEGGEAP